MTDNNQDIKDRLVAEVIKDYVWRRRWRLLSWCAISIVSLLAFIKILSAYELPVYSDHIAIVSISGEISKTSPASAEMVIPVLKEAFEDDNVKLIVLEIDSGGGSPSESERISSEIERLKKKHSKPIVSVIDALGASAAYMIAIHTDEIMAGKYSLVGSIGVIMTNWDIHRIAEKYEVGQQVYRSGKFKDLGSPFRQATDDDKKILQGLVDTAANSFIEDVQSKRGKKLAKVDLFTGQVWNGTEALKLGLIDKIGTIETITATSDMKIRRLSPTMRPSFGASFAHEIGAGIAETFSKTASSRPQYGQ